MCSRYAGDAFGGYSVAFAAFVVVLVVARGVAGTPLLMGPAATRRQEDGESAERTAALLGARVGISGGVAVALCALVSLSAESKAALLVMGTVLPVVIWEDTYRYILFARGEQRTAAALDFLWAAVQALGFWAVCALSHPGVPAFTLVWGLSAGAARLLLRSRCRTSRPAPRGKLRLDWALRRGLVAEALAAQGAQQLLLLLVAATGGIAAASGLRAVQILYSPLSLIFAGLSPLVTRQLSMLSDNRRRVHTVYVYCALYIGTGSLYCSLMAWQGKALGAALLGTARWNSTERLLLAGAIICVATGLLGAFSSLAWIMQCRIHIISLRLFTALPAIALAISAERLATPYGPVWGQALGISIGLVGGISPLIRRVAREFA